MVIKHNQCFFLRSEIQLLRNQEKFEEILYWKETSTHEKLLNTLRRLKIRCGGDSEAERLLTRLENATAKSYLKRLEKWIGIDRILLTYLSD